MRKPSLSHGEDLRDLPTYTIPEASLYLAAPNNTLRSWYQDPRVLKSSSVKETSLLSFHDLTEAFILHTLRAKFNYSMQRMRLILENLKNETGKARPLLECDLMLVFNRLVIIKPAVGHRPRLMVDLCSHGSQLAIPELVDLIGTRITKDSKRMPVAIYPWRLLSNEEQNYPVAIDPNVMSGRLVVAGTRIPVRTLLALKQSNKSDEEIADLYGLKPENVKRALLHIERPIHKKAA